ncbi:MAG: DinB family protein [Acidobacteria bacterium]|nr:DinB family protein [Acidobacteriota bacterium]
MDRTTEVWQRGPVPGVDSYLMPAAHALLQVKEDLERLAARVPDAKVWERPGGAASIGFHVRHIAGSTERLLTYARGEALTESQLAAARVEGAPGEGTLRALVDLTQAALDRALEQVRATGRDGLLAERKVGRAGLPSTTLGLMMHAAEHATRHIGQAITTAAVLGVSLR